MRLGWLLIVLLLLATVHSEDPSKDEKAIAGLYALFLLKVAWFVDLVVDTCRSGGCETLDCCIAKLEPSTREEPFLMAAIEKRWGRTEVATMETV
jgi:hypothetical protein